jgi:hypothetical protein
MNPVSSLLFTNNLSNEGPPIALLQGNVLDLFRLDHCAADLLPEHARPPHCPMPILPPLSTVPKMRGIEVINDPVCQAIPSSLPIAVLKPIMAQLRTKPSTCQKYTLDSPQGDGSRRSGHYCVWWRQRRPRARWQVCKTLTIICKSC